MEEIGPPDTHYLSAALGWMELGNCLEAKSELLKVNPGLANHPTVLEVNWAIQAAANEWPEALATAEKLVESEPNLANGWLHRAYAMRRVPGGGLQAAWKLLLPAVDRFPEEATIPYNLACYSCQMGELEEARRWLRRALGVGDAAKIRTMAFADSDLKPLWPEIKRL